MKNADANRTTSTATTTLPKTLLLCTALYFLASLGHFSHNAEFICEYPQLPGWLTSAKVYAAWAGVTAVGALGLLLWRQQRQALGLLVLACYAALGFDGLGHYAVAPMAWHSWGANATILSEVAAGAVLLAMTLWTLWTLASTQRGRLFSAR
jgi:hypothetical protein